MKTIATVQIRIILISRANFQRLEGILPRHPFPVGEGCFFSNQQKKIDKEKNRAETTSENLEKRRTFVEVLTLCKRLHKLYFYPLIIFS